MTYVSIMILSGCYTQPTNNNTISQTPISDNVYRITWTIPNTDKESNTILKCVVVDSCEYLLNANANMYEFSEIANSAIKDEAHEGIESVENIRKTLRKRCFVWFKN